MVQPVDSGSSGGIRRVLSRTMDRLGGNIARLSEGSRIQKAADDAAGLAVSENIRSRLASLDQAARNIADGSSMMRTAEGGLSQIGDILSRGRELAVQSASGSLDENRRQSLQNEFSQGLQEIERLSAVLEHNGARLLDGSLGPSAAVPVEVQAGAGSGPDDRIKIDAVDKTDLKTLGLEAARIDTPENARTALSAIDNALKAVSAGRAGIGVMEGKFRSAAENISVAKENLAAAESRIRDADFADETSKKELNLVLAEAGAKALGMDMAVKRRTAGNIINIKG